MKSLFAKRVMRQLFKKIETMMKTCCNKPYASDMIEGQWLRARLQRHCRVRQLISRLVSFSNDQKMAQH